MKFRRPPSAVEPGVQFFLPFTERPTLTFRSVVHRWLFLCPLVTAYSEQEQAPVKGSAPRCWVSPRHHSVLVRHLTSIAYISHPHSYGYFFCAQNQVL